LFQESSVPGNALKSCPAFALTVFQSIKVWWPPQSLSGVYSLTGNLDITGALGAQYQQPDYSVLATIPHARLNARLPESREWNIIFPRR